MLNLHFGNVMKSFVYDKKKTNKSTSGMEQAAVPMKSEAAQESSNLVVRPLLQ